MSDSFLHLTSIGETLRGRGMSEAVRICRSILLVGCRPRRDDTDTNHNQNAETGGAFGLQS
jgi:hypothetical protein